MGGLKMKDEQLKSVEFITSKEYEIVDVLNKMIACCKPIDMGDFNMLIHEDKKGSLEKLEKEDDRVGLRLANHDDPKSGLCTSTMALIATITDIAIGKRLAVEVDENNYITKFTWYKEE